MIAESYKANAPSDYRTALNAVRGFAALIVAFYHLKNYSDFDWFEAIPPMRFGYIGVDFFFVLSGLIISHTYLQRSYGADRGFWLKFIWYRLARLVPVHFLIMTAMLIAALIAPTPLTGQQLIDWLGQTLLVRQWFLPDAYTWNSPAWSISAELFAYIAVFPIMAWLAPSLKTKWDAVKLMGVGLLLLSALLLAHGTVNVSHSGGPLIRVVGGFIMGSGLFVLLSYYHQSVTWDRRFLGLLILAPIIVSVMFAVRSIVLADLLFIAYFVAVISCIYLAQGRIASLLSSRPLFWFGEVSFALYLCHIPVMRLCVFVANKFGLGQGLWFGLVALVLSIGVAHLLYRYVETPSRHFMRRWYKRKSGQGKLSFG